MPSKYNWILITPQKQWGERWKKRACVYCLMCMWTNPKKQKQLIKALLMIFSYFCQDGKKYMDVWFWWMIDNIVVLINGLILLTTIHLWFMFAYKTLIICTTYVECYVHSLGGNRKHVRINFALIQLTIVSIPAFA